ncbi:hypothetical protein IV102_23530, partial [bacterium]|nr:hypothetical protein [bacterium]
MTVDLGFMGCAGSAACVAAMLRANYRESVQLEADEPVRRERQRQEGAHNLVTSLACSQDQALELMRLYDNDEVRSIVEVRSWRQNVSGSVLKTGCAREEAGRPGPGPGSSRVSG